MNIMFLGLRDGLTIARPVRDQIRPLPQEVDAHLRIEAVDHLDVLLQLRRDRGVFFKHVDNLQEAGLFVG